ncbi:hypothetical protein TUM4249_06860 [Shewanella sp. KT0246]|nr:hypothetical protein TUM4249_06860 [Shewanella sp. KT0246]
MGKDNEDTVQSIDLSIKLKLEFAKPSTQLRNEINNPVSSIHFIQYVSLYYN